MKVYDYNKKELLELKQYSQRSLKFLYKTIPGRASLKVVTRPTVAKLYGKYNNSKFSKRKIKKFILKHSIDMTEYSNKNFNSFNDFFAREIKDGKREFSTNSMDFFSCADSKLSIYKISPELTLNIKNSTYDISELIQDKEIAKEFQNGLCIIYRLCVNDYHRYLFIDDGKIISNKKIKGVLHTVCPISFEKYKVFTQNAREVSVLETKHFGKIINIEVGALLVGKIKNHKLTKFKRGQEKGYFEFGGSTIIHLIQKDTVKIDDEILKYTNQNIEVQVKQGTTIGKRILKRNG